MNSEIAILLATYNGEQYLSEQLNSLVTQTFQKFICYIHDDGSSDNTQAIIDKYVSGYPNKFVIVSGNSTGSAKNNFMFLLSKVNEAYIMFCDQDDVWLDNKIETTYCAMKRMEKKYKAVPIMIFSDLRVVDEKLNMISDSYLTYTARTYYMDNYKKLIIQNVVAGCTMMINAKLRERALEIEDLSNIYMHDWWMALIASVSGKLYYINEALILYRQHRNNTVGAKSTNFADFILEKSHDIYTNNQINKTKQGICLPRLLAYELTKFELPFETQTFMECFANIGKCNKLKRVLFYINNQLFRSQYNIFRKLWMILWV